MALTEENPGIKPYKENLWADLADYKPDIDMSVQIVSAVQERWVFLMRQMTDSQWDRSFFYPEQQKSIGLKASALMYEWHERHHLAHINQAKNNL
ncbi:DinB superfamily protein [Cyclobacterium lianum]|uniref:DinB superfamily protein n=1 Tax=Cyclobacterium lianum TaxID=388280 RepID=A0A1M7LZ74_9BACT|nr:DinB superfamily protein [Cyclobacterium lianum]